MKIPKMLTKSKNYSQTMSILKKEDLKLTKENYEIGCQTFTSSVANRKSRESIAMYVSSMSFDHASKTLLIQTITKDESRFTLMLTDPCTKPSDEITTFPKLKRDYNGTHRDNTTNFKDDTNEKTDSKCSEINDQRSSYDDIFIRYSKQSNVSNTTVHNQHSHHKASHINNKSGALSLVFKDAKSLEFGRVGPVAMYNKEIYFVLQIFDLSDFGDKHSIIQIRKSKTTCSGGTRLDYPVLATDSVFELLDCSILISELVRETYHKTHEYRPLNTLLVVHQETRIDFFLQVIRVQERESASLETSVLLYQVSNLSQKFEVVYERAVESLFFKAYLFQLGGMGYKNDYICWSAIDQIICGRWKGGRLTRVRVHLKPGQAAAACEAPSTENYLANIITGVGVLEAGIGKEVKVLFGCIAQVTGFGGLGLMESKEAGETLCSVKKLSDNFNHAIHAGSLLIVDECIPSLNIASTPTIPFLLYLLLLFVFLCFK